MGIIFLSSCIKGVRLTGEARPAAQEAVFGRVDKLVSSKEVNHFFSDISVCLDINGLRLRGRTF